MIRQGLVLKSSAKTKKWLASQSRAFSFNPSGKFAEILSFHNGVAAVREQNGAAYHIDETGTSLYDSHRYKRTFGFYAANRAAVMDFDDKMFHIDITGGPAYENRYAWCGNFHAVPKEGIFRSPVRDSNNYYYYIDQHGEVALGPFSYAGDPNSAGQSVVQDFDGNPKIINHDGKNWCTAARMKELNLIEACVPHKGVAAVRNETGWFYIDQAGQEVGRGRYKFTEPHYNGQARVRCLNGQWAVIDEAGQVTVNLGESILSSAAELERMSKRYWESLALKHILENNVLQEQQQQDIMPSTPLRILEDCAVEMGLLRRGPSDARNPSSELLNRGKLLAFCSSASVTNSVTEARCRYWLQDRYLNAWLERPQDTKANRDTFADLASNPALVNQSLDVLKSYADSDWKGAAVPLSKLLDDKNDTANIRTIVDMGGGYGSLLRELQGSGLLQNTDEFICVDRPEVVASVVSSSASPTSLYHHSDLDGIKYEVGDLFDGPIRSADLYLMSRVLHDWSDPQAAVILNRMHLLSPEHARLVVIDRVSSPDQLHALLSLHMYMLQGSHERSHEQWQDLFASSGWKIDGCEGFNGHKMYLLTKASKTDENPTYEAMTTSVETADAPPTVRKALITVGGLGTRMEPQSIVTPKALVPIISRENTLDTVGLQLQPPKWEVRPALAHLLDQLHSTSHTIDQVCIVSTPWQIPLLQSFLNDYQERQKNAVTSEKKSLKIQITTQQSARGFGDAILAAREFIRNEPFVLAMGDHIYSSACVENMLAAYNELVATSDWRSTALTGVTLCGESEVQATGLLRNHQCSSYPLGSPWVVDEMVEKPSLDYDSFHVLLDGTVKYPSQLGMDVLPPGILTFLQAEKEQIAPHQEVDLRKVLRESLLGDAKLYGCLIDGKRLDIGNPGAYNKALKLIANDDSSTYLPPKRSSPAQVCGMQEQDEIMQSVLAIQQQDSGHIPATLRHLLFGRNDTTSTDSAGICIGSSPGRMDLMGGFADYSGSYAIQHPTHERVVALSVFQDETKTGSSGMIRLAAIQVDDISEMSQAIAKGDFVVNETDFPTRYLFTSDGRLKSESELKDTLSKTFAINGTAPDRWVAYLTGIIHRLYQQKSNAGDLSLGADFTIVTLSDLPWNSGLASSAAVEVATAFSLGTALQLPSDVLNPVFVALISKQVENRIVGGQCGIMDQLAVTHPGATRTTEHPLVGMRCRMPLVELPTYSLPLQEGLSVVALESGVKRSTVSTSYERVRTGAAIGKAILEASLEEKIQHLCDVTPSTFVMHEDRLPESMTGHQISTQVQGMLLSEDCFGDDEYGTTYPVREATRFPIKENLRVQMFENVLRRLESYPISTEQSLPLLGELMRQSHAGYSKCGLGTNATDWLVDVLNTGTSGVVGAKISGGGGGGAVVALVHDSFLRNSTPFEHIQERYYAKTGLMCKLRKGTSGAAKFHGALRRQFSTNRVVTDVQDPRSLSATRKPRVLVVNHGYPPDFNGGSEVYAQAVALQLKNSGQCESVHVFAREHDPYRPDFELRRTVDELDSDLPVFRMNYSREAPYFRFVAEEIDRAFQEVLGEVKPDILHLHHMNHLSLNFPALAKAAGARVIYTLHDYWLMCPRGQFLQTGPVGKNPWKLCDGQENNKCAKHCYSGRYGSGVYGTSTIGTDEEDGEQRYWASWIASRMEETRKACEQIDVFIAPSQYLYNKFIQEDFLPAEKVIVEPYGFFKDRYMQVQDPRDMNDDPSDSSAPAKTKGQPFTFAYIGRHQPAKGINLLVEASLKLLQGQNKDGLDGDSTEYVPFRVKIFGRPEANSCRSLQRMIADCPYPRAHDIISWEGEYANKDIVDKVFNEVDCVVVPSIWEENSPLVIHEAQQCKIPVITSEFGGMGELVENYVNGLTFEHRNADSLAEAMCKALEQPVGMKHLGERGYLYSSDGQIPDIQMHTERLLKLFEAMQSEDSKNDIAKIASRSWYTTTQTKPSTNSIQENATAHEKGCAQSKLQAPWRVTFDTNPDDCNYSCTMCEQHSEFSPHQKERKEKGIRRRRMDFEVIHKTVADLALRGTKEIIPTTMGEPLMYKHFPDMLDLCREHGLKLNLTTNGSFYGRGAKKWADDIVPVGSDVKISWNGITKGTQEAIMKRSDLDTQIENLRTFIKVRNAHAEEGGNYCSVTLQLTFMETNLHEFPKLIKFAIEEDCDRVKGHHLWAHFSEIKDENLRRSSESIRRWNAIAEECREIAATHKRPSGRPFRLENFNDLDESSQGAVDPDTVCPFLGQEAWVNHEGRFDPCCAPDQERLSLGRFGNITDPETQLLDIWNSDQYNNLVQNYKQHPLCKNCTMRKPVHDPSK